MKLKKKPFRAYVRHRDTGELGYLSRDFREVILDRGNSLHRTRYDERKWQADEFDLKPLSAGQVAHACWDCAMRVAKSLDMVHPKYVEWISVRVEDKAAIISGDLRLLGDDILRESYMSIYSILSKYQSQ